MTLKEKLEYGSNFLFGVELVSVRGSMTEKNAIKARDFGNELVYCNNVDWVSVTDNAGGNPQLEPHALGKPILYAGKEVVIHMTCKDMNRNGLESKAWLLNSEGFHNILAMTGDYPVTGIEGMAKPVFDIDSVALITMLNRMNNGFELTSLPGSHKSRRLEKTNFLIGAVTTNFKLLEGEVVPQYLKLQKKVECGAKFIINQVGYDSRKINELRIYMDNYGMKNIPLIGNVYVLNPRAAQIFHDKKIPGIIVTPELLELCLKYSKSADKGKSFFNEFAAKQIAIYRGLGYRGAYIGGVHNIATVEEVLEIERTFSPDDWHLFAREMKFSRPGEYFYYSENPLNGLSSAIESKNNKKKKVISSSGLAYKFSKWIHSIMFTPGSPLAKLGTFIVQHSKNPDQGPFIVRKMEILSKDILFNCQDCGDCSLPDIAYLCPESQCAKNQRNGPCGGTRDGRCEVDRIGQCIWLKAYERLKIDGKEKEMLKHAPVIQNQALRNTSAWANNWLGKDHSSKKKNTFIINSESSDKEEFSTPLKSQPDEIQKAESR